MKKKILFLLLILTGLMVDIAVAADRSESAKSDISGDVYNLSSYAGVEISSLGFSEDLMVVTLYPDGTVSVSEEGKDADSGFWTLEGNVITISAGGDEIRGTLTDDTLTLNIEGGDFVLVKEVPEPAEENEPSGLSSLVSSIWSSLTGGDKEPEPTAIEIPKPTETPAAVPTRESSSSDSKAKWTDLANSVRDFQDSKENEQTITELVQPTKAPVVPTAVPTAIPTADPTPGITASSFKAGDTFTFGHYEQDNVLSNGPEPIEWQVLAVEDGRALVTSKYSLDAKPYNKDDKYVTWENCSLRDWLNNEFFNSAFSNAEQEKIAWVTNKNPSYSEFRASDGNDTVDHVFLLSEYDLKKYFPSQESRRCKATAYARAEGVETVTFFIKEPEGEPGDYWWLRNHGGNMEGGYTAAMVYPLGNDGIIFMSYWANGVRPALWLNPDGTAGSTGLKRPDSVYTEPAKQVQPPASSETGRYVDSCRMKSYLKPGDHAEVVTERGLKLRKKPAGAETGIQAFSGKDVQILDGPVCRNGAVWFEINFLGYRGWSMEGLDGIYYLRKTNGTPSRPDPSPKKANPTPRPTASSGDTGARTGNSKYLSRLKIGDTVEVINTGGLQLYMTPNGKYYDGVAAWPGKAAKVTDGPQYDKNGSIWWEIDFLGHRGWVLEVTSKGTYYLEKK